MGAITYILSPSLGHFKAMGHSNATGFGNLKGPALMALANAPHRGKFFKKKRSTPKQREHARLMGALRRITGPYGSLAGDLVMRAVDTDGEPIIDRGGGNKGVAPALKAICDHKGGGDPAVILAELGAIPDVADPKATVGFPEAGIYVVLFFGEDGTATTWNVDFDPDPDGGSATVTYLDPGKYEGTTEYVNAQMMALLARRAEDDDEDQASSD